MHTTLARLRIFAAILFVVLFTGTVGFVVLEGMSVVDALYFSVGTGFISHLSSERYPLPVMMFATDFRSLLIISNQMLEGRQVPAEIP